MRGKNYLFHENQVLVEKIVFSTRTWLYILYIVYSGGETAWGKLKHQGTFINWELQSLAGFIEQCAGKDRKNRDYYGL